MLTLQVLWFWINWKYRPHASEEFHFYLHLNCCKKNCPDEDQTDKQKGPLWTEITENWIYWDNHLKCFYLQTSCVFCLSGAHWFHSLLHVKKDIEHFEPIFSCVSLKPGVFLSWFHLPEGLLWALLPHHICSYMGLHCKCLSEINRGLGVHCTFREVNQSGCAEKRINQSAHREGGQRD